MRAVDLKRDIENTVKEAVEAGKISLEIPVEFITGEAAKVYSNSKMSEVSKALGEV
jgi:predicted transcriptional regulator